MEILGLGTQSRFLVNMMPDSPAKNPNSVFCSSPDSYPCHLLNITQAENCYCKIIFNSSLLFHAIQYFPASGFILFFFFFPDLTQKVIFSLSPKSSNLVWATICMKDVVDNTGGLLPSNSPV